MPQPSPSQTPSGTSRKRNKSQEQAKHSLRSVEGVLDLLEQLPRVRLGVGYTEIDRAADFIAVFGGERGKKVLAQIVDFCSPHPSPRDAEKPGLLAFKEGQRWVLAEVMRAFVPQSRVPVIERKPHDDRPNP